MQPRPPHATRFLPCALVLALAAPAAAQVTPLPHDRGGVGLGLALRHLGVDGSLLYVTAHPDDENNGVLVKYQRGLGVETSLLTVTRGDGGQNEIGPELFQAIGILRSEELAGVHRYDGVAQFHTRAYEFGYSFSVEETFDKWGREEILRDVVRVVRTVRPDVILTMNREGSGGGQHHMASARLAHEAFRAAADPTRFPEQIEEGLRPWQARKVYQSAGGRNQRGREGSVTIDTSHHDPLLQMSWNQFGALARRAHRCQGMGQLEARPGFGGGAYALVDSEPAVTATEEDVFEGIDTSLARWADFAEGQEAPFLQPGIEAIQAAAHTAQESFDIRAPHESLGALTAGLGAVRDLQAKVAASGLDDAAKRALAWRLAREERDFEKALGLAQGLEIHVTVDDGDVVPGQTFGVTAAVWNTSPVAVRVDGFPLRLSEGWTAELQEGQPGTLEGGAGLEMKYAVTVAADARYSQPYWKRNFEVDRYDIEIPEHHTLPWSPPDVVGELEYSVGDTSASLSQPAHYRYDGPWVGGEKQKVVNVVPALSVHLTPEVAIIPLGAAAEAREFRVEVQNGTPGASSASVRLETPEGWTVEPAEAALSFALEGEKATARFFVTPAPGVAAGEFAISAVAEAGGAEYREGYQVIAYDHIQERHLFHPAEAEVKTVDVDIREGISIGYVRGAGDEVPPAIEMLGIPLTFLTPDDIAFGDLSRFTTIVTGIRAYQTRPDLKTHHKRLMDYVERGGNLVVQYNKFEFNQLEERGGGGFGQGANAEPPPSPFAPYPAVVSRNRITVEEAEVQMLEADSPLLIAPNRISDVDFEDWVQERGLYFLDARGEEYVELLASEDPWPKNPGVKTGMLVTAPVGRGSWTYVGIGLWRQLPAGTTGAYRILANLLSQPRGDVGAASRADEP